MIQYLHNNIIFRIASSDAISKFKSAQAHTFVQLARPDLKFNGSVREVVLLEYDKISQWLYKIEHIMRLADTKLISKSLLLTVTGSFNEEFSIIENVVDNYADIFNTSVSSFVKMIHHYSFPIVEEKITSQLIDTVERGFVSLVDIMTEYLQHLLLCLHEYNNNCLVKSDAPFISSDMFCIICDTPMTNSCLNCEHAYEPTLKRISFFIEQGCGNEYILKDYTPEDICMFDSIVRKIADFNKNIILIREIFPEVENLPAKKVAFA